MNVLEMKNVTKSYHTGRKLSTQVLSNISLTLKYNEFVGIMGTSGSGKTTLLNLASGIDQCDDGEIDLWENNICDLDKNELALFRRSNMGMVFQDFNLLSSLTIKENIMVPLILDKKYELIDSDAVTSFAKMLDIEDILDHYPYEVSGGQQQRAAICRAIINDPKIIFADEPTGNLDSGSSKKVMEYFERVHQKYKTSILMVTHDPFSACHCERVIFLDDGAITNEITKQGDEIGFLHQIMDVLQEFNAGRKGGI